MLHDRVGQVVDDQLSAVGQGTRSHGRHRSRCPSERRRARPPAACTAVTDSAGSASVVGGRRPQVGGADHGSVQPRHREDLARRRRTPAGDSIMPITRVSSSRRRRCSPASHQPEAPGSGVGGEAALAQRRVVHGRDQGARRPRVCRCAGRRSPWLPGRGPAGPAPARAEPTRTSTAAPCSGATAMCCRSAIRSAGPCSQSISTKSKPLTATISTSSSAGIRSSTPSSCSPRVEPGLQRAHQATIPADRSMSAPHSPGMASMATTAAPDLDLGHHPAQGGPGDEGLHRPASYVRPVRSASSRKLRSIRGPVDRTGGQAVDVHPGRSDLEGQGRGQADHRHLGGAVRRPPDQRPLARHRGEVDHVTVAARDHGRQERPTDQEDAADVDVEDLVPLRRRDLGQRRDRPGDARRC